jgi:predicted metal-binding membrane protein
MAQAWAALEPVSRIRTLLLATLLALAAGAWLLTEARMAGMDAGPGTDPGTLGFFAISWVVMMAAMMFPSISPMVLVFASIQHRRRDRGGASVSRTIFIAGYMLAWTAFGLTAYGLYVGLRALSIDVLAWDRAGRWVAVGVIAAAALYQLTPAKDACLRRCRGPLQFLTERWRDGRAGALRMGFEHGGWCVGCCWGLMATLFALGVMSLAWMVLVAGLIAVEKMLPTKAVANRLVTLVLVMLALALALVPAEMPALTQPGSPAAHEAEMRMMGPEGGDDGTMHPERPMHHPDGMAPHKER